MNKIIRRTLQASAIAGGIVLAGSAAAQANDDFLGSDDSGIIGDVTDNDVLNVVNVEDSFNDSFNKNDILSNNTTVIDTDVEDVNVAGVGDIEDGGSNGGGSNGGGSNGGSWGDSGGSNGHGSKNASGSHNSGGSNGGGSNGGSWGGSNGGGHSGGGSNGGSWGGSNNNDDSGLIGDIDDNNVLNVVSVDNSFNRSFNNNDILTDNITYVPTNIEDIDVVGIGDIE